MKTITLAEFGVLVARNDWVRLQDSEIIEQMFRQEQRQDDETGDIELIDIPHVWGFATMTSSLDGIDIVYSEGFNYDENEPDSLTSGTEGQDEVWTVAGVAVTDEDGEAVSAHKLADYLPSEFSEIDYSRMATKETNDIDVAEDSDMETVTLQIDNEPNVRFTGELLGSAASSDNEAMGSSFSGQTGRWAELSLYKTKGGKYICHQVGRTRWQGERDRFSGKVCETLDEVKQFFGHRWLAKELYAEAGIDDAVEIK